LILLKIQMAVIIMHQTTTIQKPNVRAAEDIFL